MAYVLPYSSRPKPNVYGGPTSISGFDFIDSTDVADSESPWSKISSARLECAFTHVFLPFPLEAQHQDRASVDDHLLIRPLCDTARGYSEVIDDTLKPQWGRIAKMLDNWDASISSGCSSSRHLSQLYRMETGGTLLISLDRPFANDP